LIALLHIGTWQDCLTPLPKHIGQCKLIQDFCAMPKVELANMAPLLQYANGQIKEDFMVTNNVEHGIWFYHDDIEHYVSGNTK
jgi:hypothetical protein